MGILNLFRNILGKLTTYITFESVVCSIKIFKKQFHCEKDQKQGFWTKRPKIWKFSGGFAPSLPFATVPPDSCCSLLGGTTLPVAPLPS
jgi:hypothetical protein